MYKNLQSSNCSEQSFNEISEYPQNLVESNIDSAEQEVKLGDGTSEQRSQSIGDFLQFRICQFTGIALQYVDAYRNDARHDTLKSISGLSLDQQTSRTSTSNGELGSSVVESDDEFVDEWADVCVGRVSAGSQQS